MIRWPLVRRSTYDALRTENHMLRDALRNANDELRKHRELINGLRAGLPKTMEQFDRVIAAGRKVR